MTNAIIMSAMLSTNWDVVMSWEPAPATNTYNMVHRAEIHRYVDFHIMEGTNKVRCGQSLHIKAGTIYKTNGVLGPIIWDKP